MAKLYTGSIPIKNGSIIYYNGVKYKILSVESSENKNSDESSIILKTKVVKQNN